jgi:hypothetical protein
MRLKRRTGVLFAYLVATGCSSSGGNGNYVAAKTSGTSGGGAGATSGDEAFSDSPPPGSGSIASSGSIPSSGSVAASGTPAQTGSSSGAQGGSGSGSSTTGSATSGEGSGASGDSGSMGVSGAGTGSTSGVASSGSGAAAGPFTCNLVLGLFTTSQWFNGTNPGGATKDFLMDGVDATKWESKTLKYSYIEKWIPANSTNWNLTTNNPCAVNSTMPDRVVFVGFSPGTTSMDQTQAGWETLLNGMIATIRMKYPSVKEIDLLTMGRAPNNTLCANNNDVWTVIPAYEDAAYAAVAAASTTFPIVVGPKYYVPDCNSYEFANDTDYTVAGSNAIAQQLATYYAAHP